MFCFGFSFVSYSKRPVCHRNRGEPSGSREGKTRQLPPSLHMLWFQSSWECLGTAGDGQSGEQSPSVVWVSTASGKPALPQWVNLATKNKASDTKEKHSDPANAHPPSAVFPQLGQESQDFQQTTEKRKHQKTRGPISWQADLRPTPTLGLF